MNSIRQALEERGYKTYVGEGILIFWNPTKCRHAKECVTGSPAAFDIQRRPWIEPDAAPAKELAAIIDRCPTGALWYELL